jgi:hypothetical protein
MHAQLGLPPQLGGTSTQWWMIPSWVISFTQA